jgi:hypothetical protein
LLTPAEFDRLRVVLVSTRNPLNIGASARAMSNFGFRHLRVEKVWSKFVENPRREYRIPRPAHIDLPQDSLRLGFDRCPNSHRLLDPTFG